MVRHRSTPRGTAPPTKVPEIPSLSLSASNSGTDGLLVVGLMTVQPAAASSALKQLLHALHKAVCLVRLLYCLLCEFVSEGMSIQQGTCQKEKVYDPGKTIDIIFPCCVGVGVALVLVLCTVRGLYGSQVLVELLVFHLLFLMENLLFLFLFLH